jgi:hypothetical protein
VEVSQWSDPGQENEKLYLEILKERHSADPELFLDAVIQFQKHRIIRQSLRRQLHMISLEKWPHKIPGADQQPPNQ